MIANEQKPDELRYGYLDPLKGSRNYGDAIIDHATQILVAKHLPAPAARLDPFSTIPPEDEFDFILVPGITTLTRGDRPFMALLNRLTCPVYCLAGNIWAPVTGKNGWLLRSRVLFARAPEPPSVVVPAALARPVGTRDPFSHDLLGKNSIESIYVGCPTLHLPAVGIDDDGFLLFSFGRDRVRDQVRAAHRFANSLPVVGYCHEPGDRARYLAAGWKFPLIDYTGDVETYLSYIRRARVVVTGRLHGVLPALAYRKPVFYFGTSDSRTTILNDLGISIHDHHELRFALDRATPACNRELIATYRGRISDLLNRILDAHTEEQ